MKEYIEREALIKEGWLLQRTVYGNGSATIESKQLKAIPAADVVEVVRCKDCRYFYNGHDEMCCINHKGVVVTNENGFCHHAKRREDEGGDA